MKSERFQNLFPRSWKIHLMPLLRCSGESLNDLP